MDRGLAPSRWRLSEEGRRRSVVLADVLERYGPGVVVSSEEPKAVGTAGLVAERLGIECCARPGLHEHDRTGAPFLSDEDLAEMAQVNAQGRDPTTVIERKYVALIRAVQ